MSHPQLPHGLQPSRLLRPWDFPGKNTGVGCHFLLQCMKVKSESEVAQSCLTLSNPMDCSPPGPSIHGSFQARVLEWGTIEGLSSVQFSSVAQSCPTLSDPVDCSPPSSSIHGIFQARVLEWGAIAFSDIYIYIHTHKMGLMLSICFILNMSLKTFPGIKPRSPALQADSLLS